MKGRPPLCVMSIRMKLDSFEKLRRLAEQNDRPTSAMARVLILNALGQGGQSPKRGLDQVEAARAPKTRGELVGDGAGR